MKEKKLEKKIKRKNYLLGVFYILEKQSEGIQACAVKATEKKEYQ